MSNPEKVSAEKVQSKIARDIKRTGFSEIKGILLEETLVVSPPRSSSQIVFERCIFRDKVTIKSEDPVNRIHFNSCTIDGLVFVAGGIVIKEFSFNGCWLNSPVQFDEDSEIKGISFSGCRTIKQVVVANISCKVLNIVESFASSVNIDLGCISGSVNIVMSEISGISLRGWNSSSQVKIAGVKVGTLSLTDIINSQFIEIDSLTPLNSHSKIMLAHCSAGRGRISNIDFRVFESFEFENSSLLEMEFTCCQWGDNFVGGGMSEVSKMENLLLGYRHLRLGHSRQGDAFYEHFFYQREMLLKAKIILSQLQFNRSIFQSISDLLIIKLSNWLTRFGVSILRPLFFWFVTSWIALFLLVGLSGYRGLQISNPFDAESIQIGIGEFVTFLNPLHEPDPNAQGWEVLLDSISRVFSSFFIYSLIRASRRFIK